MQSALTAEEDAETEDVDEDDAKITTVQKVNSKLVDKKKPKRRRRRRRPRRSDKEEADEPDEAVADKENVSRNLKRTLVSHQASLLLCALR